MSAVIHDFRGPRISVPPSHVGPLTPIHQARAAGHPSVYDGAGDDIRPVLPQLVGLSLSVLVQHARNPVAVPRPRALEAAEIVTAWAKGVERDATPPHGTGRGVQ